MENKNLLINSLFLIIMFVSLFNFTNSIRLKSSQISIFSSNSSNISNINNSLGNFTKCENTFDDKCYLEGLLKVSDIVKEKYGMVDNEDYYYTASHGNFNKTANVNETIKKSDSQRVCRMINTTNLVLVDKEESIDCHKDLFNSKSDNNCECSYVYKSNWEFCGKENQVCNKTGLIRFGNNGTYKYQEISKEFICDSQTFGGAEITENYCWRLKKNDPVLIKTNEHLAISEMYRTCNLVKDDGSILSNKIITPFTEFICSNASFGNLSTEKTNCVCYSFIN